MSAATSSWVPGADGSGFGLNNLPLGVCSHPGGAAGPCVRIGEHVLVLRELDEALVADAVDPDLVRGPDLQALMAAGRATWQDLRALVQQLLAADGAFADRVRPALHLSGDVSLHLPFRVADYVDFYSSMEHAGNLGQLFRPGSPPLMPNWRHLPVGYHGRGSTFVLSGTPVRRPNGQRLLQGDSAPTFGPSLRLDYELEVGFVVGAASQLGHPVAIEDAAEHLFGAVLLNDWSARDVQAWEYQPLGPFLGKSFATTVSPWIVSLEALKPFRVEGPVQEPPVLDYLSTSSPWAFDVDLKVELRTEAMRQERLPAMTLSRTNLRGLYWNPAQHLAHTTVNGAALSTGDVHASGTVSGSEASSFGSLIELAWNGARPVALPDGSERSFLLDGDQVTLRGAAARPGVEQVSFGEAEGTIIAAP